MELTIFSTCPPSSVAVGDAYLQAVIDAALWSDSCECEGTLIYSDNSLVDPWLLAQEILKSTQRLCPLVAVQPVYMHPYTVAKKVTSLAHLYRRRVYLNMVAGGFKGDLNALNDPTPHDERYGRLVEYTAVIHGLLGSAGPFNFEGRYYTVRQLKLTPPLPPDLLPGVLVSGSSEAGLQAARSMGATAVRYPRPADVEEGEVGEEAGVSLGIRVGLIARADPEEAWRVAQERFPEDRKGQLTHQLAMKVSDSVWHKQLAGVEGEAAESPYWLHPFHTYKTFCPYLVGSYEVVAGELARYFGLGYRTVILDVPPSEEELQHNQTAIRRAQELARGAQ